MRATMHNGRYSKDGVYNAKHNDRQFNLQHAPHINTEKTDNNYYEHRYEKIAPNMSFEDAEKRFYNETFSAALIAQNERYIKNGHRERCKTTEDLRLNPRTCPEETIMTIGKKGDTIDIDTLKSIVRQQIKFERKFFPNVKYLDVALHVDEEGAPHFHTRKVWVAHNQDGCIVSQNKALAEMGVEAPNRDQPITRYNNPKITYSAICRDNFLELCYAHGIEVEERPQEPSRSGLSLIEYKNRQEVERQTQELKKIEEKIKELKNSVELQKELEQTKKQLRQHSYDFER
jgi:hypothetical protein